MTIAYDVEGDYLQLPVTVDAATLIQDALASIQASLPGWQPRESHIEVLLLEQIAAMVAETAAVAAQVPLAIFSYMGTLVGINPEQGSFSSAQTTWTMSDTKGYTVPAGTLVAYQILGNELYQFQTVTQFTVPSGSLSTTPGAVLIQATAIGDQYDGLTPQTLSLVTSLSYVASITSTTTSSGGTNTETTQQYLDRLSDELQLLTPRPILPQDFATLAQSVAGVFRAAAYNNLNPYANILAIQDSQFSTGLATWGQTLAGGSTTNCTVSVVTGGGGEQVIKMTCGAGGVDAVVSTGPYPVSQNETYLALLQWDNASTPATVAVGVNVYDVNGTLLGASPFECTPVTDSTSKTTFTWVTFDTPADAFTAKVFADVTTPSNTDTHTFGFASLMNLTTPTNLVPDSSIQHFTDALSWVTSGTWTVPPYITGVNGFEYLGTGSASGTTTTATSVRTLLPAGTYAMSGYIDATNYTPATSAQPEWLVKNDSGTTLATAAQVLGVAGTVATTFTLGSPTIVHMVATTNNATIQSGLTLLFAQPQIVLGANVPYTVGPTYGTPGAVNNNERMVTVAAVDDNGLALSPTIDAQLATYLESQRETNFIVNVIGPSYTSIDVTWTGIAQQSANPSTVQAAGDAALAAYLSPANWAGGSAVPPFWDANQTLVRYLSVVTLLGETPGLDHLVSVNIGYHGGSLSTSDVSLVGNGPLPVVGTITGTVTSG